MRFIISEDEKKQIKLLYEQKTTVSAITLNDIAIGLLPSNFVKTINTELNQNDELKEKVNQIYNEQLPKNPLTY